MLKIKLACALLALIVALYSATAVVAVKINLAVALLCIAMAIALLDALRETGKRRPSGPSKFPG